MVPGNVRPPVWSGQKVFPEHPLLTHQCSCGLDGSGREREAASCPSKCTAGPGDGGIAGQTAQGPLDLGCGNPGGVLPVPTGEGWGSCLLHWEAEEPGG